jgi:hypothetical protein
MLISRLLKLPDNSDESHDQAMQIWPRAIPVQDFRENRGMVEEFGQTDECLGQQSKRAFAQAVYEARAALHRCGRIQSDFSERLQLFTEFPAA